MGSVTMRPASTADAIADICRNDLREYGDSCFGFDMVHLAWKKIGPCARYSFLNIAELRKLYRKPAGCGGRHSRPGLGYLTVESGNGKQEKMRWKACSLCGKTKTHPPSRRGQRDDRLGFSLPP